MKESLNLNINNPYSCFGDSNISWKAKGIIIYIMTSTDTSLINIKDLEKVSKDGLANLKSGINELIKEGYIVQVNRGGEMDE